MSLFEQQWQTYRTVLDHDSMEHIAVADATAATFWSWCDQRRDRDASVALVDLGCGDLAHLAPLYRSLPLSSYIGLDLTASVLALAESQMGQAGFPCRWIHGDLLDWAQEKAEAQVDLIHSAFAIHHLSDLDKVRFLKAARRRIADDGLLVWADVFQQEHETRDHCLERYASRVQHWPGLSSEQRNAVVDHMRRCDIPARRGWIESVAADSGWTWTWAWDGQHRAEAVVVLEPCL